MGTNEPYKNPLFLKIEFCHQSIRIAFDIKNNSAVFKNTGICITFFEIIWRFPI
jgi:hypothetical protein